jgi:RHS repeat-associated protein
MTVVAFAFAACRLAPLSHSFARYSFYSPELHLFSRSALVDLTATNTPPIETDFLWLGEEPIAQRSAATSSLRYTFTDYLGTPILQTDASANVVWWAEYEPFGNVFAMHAGNRGDQVLRLPGQEVAEFAGDATEQSYNIFRWYRSGWGRYTQADPIGLSGGLNLFGYAGARPTRFIDPTGLVRVSCCGENLQRAIDNARLRMQLLETTGSEDNPNGSNVAAAETDCRIYTMFDPQGRTIRITDPQTSRSDRFENGRCEFLCTSVHEAYHREQCREFGQLGLYPLLTRAQREWPAYREELRCLTSAQRNQYLNVRSSPPGFVEY